MKQNQAREHRIAMEAVIDAYNEIERAMGWYYYLEGKLKIPFKARCKAKRAISPLKVGEVVEVVGMAPEEECEAEMFVLITHADDRLAVPLAQLESLSKDQETEEAIGDWHYWVAQGYQF
ncbi:MAG: calcium-binding protein [Georgfuchsia sp.]